MKSRGYVFMFGLLLGLMAGFFLGQAPYRAELRTGFLKMAATLDHELQHLARKARGEPEPPPAQPPLQTDTPNPAPKKSPADASAYIREFVTVRGVQARRDPTPAGQAIVSGTVSNSGARRLQTVEVVVFFLGQEGIVREARANAIRDKPLDAQMERAFAVQVPDVSSDWVQGKVRVAVTDVTFAE